jgi:outer membrane lipoprotein SlyB
MHPENTLQLIAVSGIVVLTAAGCASQGDVSRDSLDSTIAVNYGTVATLTPVKLDSDAARNATVGGLVGLLTQARGSGTERLVGAAIGAAVGGLATKAAEGDNMANSFVVNLSTGGTVKVVTEQQNIVVGDCVAVETGRHTNLRRVSPTQCNPPSASQLHPTIDPQISMYEKGEANACHQAKEELLNAKTENEVNALTRKVQVICDH